MAETNDSGSSPAEVQLDMFGPPQVASCEPDAESVSAELAAALAMARTAGLSEDDIRQLHLEFETELARLAAA
jgi:hypothetical protein